jgi:hypothetical protein
MFTGLADGIQALVCSYSNTLIQNNGIHLGPSFEKMIGCRLLEC